MSDSATSLDASIIQKEVLGRVGKDHLSGRLFIKELSGLETGIADKTAQILNMSGSKLHDLTCVVKVTRNGYKRVRSASGTPYLAEKLLKLKVKVIIEECELIDDSDTQAP